MCAEEPLETMTHGSAVRGVSARGWPGQAWGKLALGAVCALVLPALTACSTSPSLAPGGDPTLGADWGPTRTVELVTETEVVVPGGEGAALDLWIPVPVTNGYQAVAPVDWDLDWVPDTETGAETDAEGFGGHAELTRSDAGNAMLHVSAPAGQGAGKLVVTVRARIARGTFNPGGAPDGSGRARPEDLLGPDDLVPLDGPVAAFAASVPSGDDDFVTGRHIFDAVLDSMAYDKSVPGWGRGDAVRACDVKTGNCTDFHALFIGAARARGIPARFTIGYSIPREPTADITELGGYHCWAEYHVDGRGWVPVDISEADKDPARTEAFFGSLTPDRVSLTSGRDLRLAPPQRGDPLNYFVAPYAERGDSPVADLAHRVTVRDL